MTCVRVGARALVGATMPTADEFDHAAALLTIAADDVGALLDSLLLRLADQPVLGGRLLQLVEVAEGAFRADRAAMITSLEWLAAEARRRAEETRHYAATVARWEQARAEHDWAMGRWHSEVAAWEADGSMGARPRRPTFSWSYPLPPAAWAEL